MKKVVLYIITISIASTVLHSQAMFVNEGNAYGFSGLYQSDEVDGGKTNTSAGQFSYLLDGNMELAVSYNMASFKDDVDSEYDLKANGFSFGGWYHIKNESLPFVLKLGGLYGSISYDSDLMDDLGMTIRTTSSGFGGGIYKMVSETDSYTMTPFVNFSSVKTEAKMKLGSESTTMDDDYNVFSFGIAVKFNNNIWIQPIIGQVDGESSFSIGFGTYFLQI